MSDIPEVENTTERYLDFLAHKARINSPEDSWTYKSFCDVYSAIDFDAIEKYEYISDLYLEPI